jgi:hypothetical protein
MTYYGRSKTGADGAPGDDGNKRHLLDMPNQGGDGAKQFPKRSNWAWAVGRANYDWMEAHSPSSSYD